MIPPLIKKNLPPPTQVAQHQTCYLWSTGKERPSEIWVPSHLDHAGRIAYAKRILQVDAVFLTSMPRSASFRECCRTRMVNLE